MRKRFFRKPYVSEFFGNFTIDTALKGKAVCFPAYEIHTAFLLDIFIRHDCEIHF